MNAINGENLQGPTRRKIGRKQEGGWGFVVDEEGKRVEKGDVADDEVSCRCSMILRQYQRLKKDGVERQGTRARRDPEEKSFQSLFWTGRVGWRVMGCDGEQSCGMWLLRKRR